MAKRQSKNRSNVLKKTIHDEAINGWVETDNAYVNISKAILPVGLLSIDCSVSHENNMTLGFVVLMVDA